jgi:hypothetical protein
MGFAILLTLASAVLINWAWIREHDAASALPPLSVRRPRESLKILFTDRAWLTGFLTESGGFLCYVGALALAPLALVQSLSAGNESRLPQRAWPASLARRELLGV